MRGETIRGLFADIVRADRVVDDKGLVFLGDTFFTVAISLVVVDPETAAIEIKFLDEKNVTVFLYICYYC